MGGQGLLLRKVTLDKTLNQLRIFLKGAFVILLMYMINGMFLEKNFQTKDIQLVTGLYLLVALGFLFLRQKKKSLKNNTIMQSIEEYFDITKFKDVERLDKKLIKEIRDSRKFVVGSGQIVGTNSFILFDLIDGQFHLIPAKSIKKMKIDRIANRYCLSMQTTVKTENIFFKKRKDASNFIEEYRKNY